MIDDHELAALFLAESEEHLLALDQGLLALETQPGDLSALDAVFRAAHSLKGAARMLGVAPVEELAHSLEDALGAAKRGSLSLNAETLAPLVATLNSIRQLVHAAVGAGAPEPEPEPVPVAEPPAPAPARPAEAQADVPAEPAPPAVAPAVVLETIRVDSGKLDALLSMAGEANVTTSRVERGFGALDTLAELWEEWCKESASPARGPQSARRQAQRLERFGALLDDLRKTTGAEVARLSFVVGELEEAIRNIRLMPLSTVFNQFPRMVHDLARSQGKQVQLSFEGAETTADKRIIEEIKDPLMHLLRNGCDHGLETPEERTAAGKPAGCRLVLRAYRTAANVVVEVSDDGRGLDLAAIARTAERRGLATAEELAALDPARLSQFIFRAGFSTAPVVTDVSGRGVGLDVVRENLERLKGSIEVESVPGHGCTFRLRLPITLATTHVLLVAAGGRRYAVPVEHVGTSVLLAPTALFPVERRQTMLLEDQPVPVVALSDLLELPVPDARAAAEPDRRLPCLVLQAANRRLGVLVDELLDEQEIVLQPLGQPLKRVRNVAGATILGTGEVCMVLNAVDLLRSAERGPRRVEVARPAVVVERRRSLLLAEDSITTRTQLKRILEAAGYDVTVAVDGADAWQQLSSREFDGLVSDVEMPNLDGFALTARLRAEARYAQLPVILVTSLSSDEHRRRGIEVGASAYVTKGGFDQRLLLDTLRRLV